MTFRVITERRYDGAPIVRYTFPTWEEAHGEAVWILNDEKVPVEIHRDGELIWFRGTAA